MRTKEMFSLSVYFFMVLCGQQIIQKTKQKSKRLLQSQAWWYMPVIPALGRLRQEDLVFEASLSYIVKLCVKKSKPKPANQTKRHQNSIFYSST
jgi:hypothetical protein